MISNYVILIIINHKGFAMNLNINQLKAVDLVAFCKSCYGMKFQRKGNVFVCLSPFGEEKKSEFCNPP